MFGNLQVLEIVSESLPLENNNLAHVLPSQVGNTPLLLGYDL